MANLTSSLTIKLIDDVSKPARTVAQALKEAEKAAEAVAKGMGKSGSDPFRRQLASLKLTANELRDVRKEWLLYARAQKQAMGADWAAKGAATMRAWEKQTVSSIRAAKKEQLAFSKSIAAAAGARGAGLGGKLRGGLSDFATFALPGTAGMAMGLGAGAAGGLAVGGAAAYSMKEAIAFDKAMANVRKKVNLAPGQSMADVEGIINNAARSMGMARTEAAEMAATAGAAGVDFKDLASFIDLTAKSATAFDMPAKQAAQAIAEVRAQTGWTNPQLKTFADKVNYLGDTSAAAEKDVLGMFQRSAAAAKASGVDFDTSLAAMTALRSGGMQEDVSARFFANFAQRLRVAGQLGKKSAEGFKELGLSLEDVRKGMQVDAQGTILKVLDRLEKSPDKVGVGLKIFGQEWADEAARFTQVIPEMRRLMEGLRIGAYQGSLDTALKIDLDTTTKKFDQLKASASELADTLARPMLPGLNSVLDGATSRIESLINWLNPKKPAAPQPGSIANYEDRFRLNANTAPPKPVFNQMPGAGFGYGTNKAWATNADTSMVAGRASISENILPAFSRMQGIPMGKALDRIVIEEAGKDRFPGMSLRGVTAKDRAAISLPKAPEPVTALPPRRPADLVPATKVEKPAAVVQRAAPAAPVVKKPEPLPAPVSVISRPAPAPSPAPAPVAKPASPAPLPAQELKVLPTFAAIPPLPAQEMSVTPKIDASAFASFQSLVSGATSAFSTLNTTVTPNVNTSALDQVPPKAESARASLQGLNTTVSPNVDTGSISAAIGQVQHLLSLLNSVGGAANSAAAGANRAAAAARSAAASMAGLGRVQRGNFSYGGVQGE